MRAREFIREDITEEEGVMHHEHESAMSNLSTHPAQNMYHGSAYLHSQYLKALAGAGAGDTPDAYMGEPSWHGGNPVFSPYHPLETEMMDRAAKHVGDTSTKNWGDKRSIEPDNVHKVSPIKDRGPISLKGKK